MKKFFYGLCTILACAFSLIACSDEESSDRSRESINRERLEGIIKKYDINFVLNDSILSTEISEVDIEEFEVILKALSGIRGTYKLHADSVGEGTYFGKQIKKPQRNRRLGMSNENVTYETLRYDNQSIPDNYNFYNHYVLFYTCSCNVEWKKVNGRIQWVKIFPNIAFENLNNYSIEVWGNNYDVFMLSDSTFRFDGSIHGDVLKNFTYYGYVTFLYEGSVYSSNNGDISWTHLNTSFMN